MDFIAKLFKNFFLVEERMKLCSLLWDNNFKAEHSYKKSPKLLSQLQYCEENGIPIAVVIGESELQNNTVKLRDIPSRVEVEICRDNLINELKSRLEKLHI